MSKPTNPKDFLGVKKAPLHLLSPHAKAAWAVAQLVGASKYGAWNWRVTGVRASVYIAAIQRHLDKWVEGEETDTEDGQHHLGAVMASAAILLDAIAAGKLVDDRPPSVSLGPAYQAAEKAAAHLAEKYADIYPRHYTISDTHELSNEVTEEETDE